VLESGGKICTQELKVEGGIKFHAFHVLPKQKFLGVLFFASHTVTGVVYLDTFEELLMLFWKKTILFQQ